VAGISLSPALEVIPTLQDALITALHFPSDLSNSRGRASYRSLSRRSSYHPPQHTLLPFWKMPIRGAVIVSSFAFSLHLYRGEIACGLWQAAGRSPECTRHANHACRNEGTAVRDRNALSSPFPFKGVSQLHPDETAYSRSGVSGPTAHPLSTKLSGLRSGRGVESMAY